MGRGKSYKPYATALKTFLCRKYGGYKRDINKQCVGCPASGEVCYMNEILNTLEPRRKKNEQKI